MSNLFRTHHPGDRTPEDSATDPATERDTEETGTATSRNGTHDLTGSVTLAEYNANTDTKTVGDMTVPAIAYAATGASTGDRDVSDGERALYARRIDEGVRGFASWVQSRPVEERIAFANTPVIHVASEGDAP